MKVTLVNFIVALVRQVVGAELWGAIFVAVQYQDSTNRTGEEKRAIIVEQAKTLFSGVASWMIGLAIESAVAKLRVTK